MAQLRAGMMAALVAVVGMLPAAPVSAETRLSQFQRQTRLIDNRLAAQYQGSTRFQPGGRKIVSEIDVEVVERAVPRYAGRRSAYLPHARAAARKHGVPEDLFLRLVQQESGWNPNARSHKGATGLAQLMPGTAAKLGVNPNDPIQNLEGGARYLRLMYNTFGSWRLALAAYNAGPAAVAKYGGVPPYRETTVYVRIIAGS